MKTVIFVLGMHRSGTSALTGALNLIQIDLGTKLIDHPKYTFVLLMVVQLS